MAEEITIEVPTLGRAVQLGMLYDCRCDALLAGPTVQDPPDMEGICDVGNKRDIRLSIIPSDSLDAKAIALGMGDSLKASCLSGLVELAGSARYFNDRISSRQQYRLSLHFKATTRSRQMSTEHIGRYYRENHEFYKQSSATHVVAGIIYGVNAFFVFDRPISTSENRLTVESSVYAMVKTLAESPAEKRNLSASEKLESEKIRCTFFGDFMPETNVSNYAEAQTTCLTLPSLLTETRDVSVPVRIKLCPLSMFHTTAGPLRHIRTDLISRFQEPIEAEAQLEARLNDMISQQICEEFPQFREKLDSCLTFQRGYLNTFKQQWACALPKVRSRNADVQELTDLLEEYELSPYNMELADVWLKQKEKEMNLVKTYMKAFAGFKVITTREILDELVLDPLTEYVICFSFSLLSREEEYLQDLARYVSPSRRQYILQKAWFDDAFLIKRMRIKAKSFVDFAKANIGHSGITFAVTGFDDGDIPSDQGGCIFLYENGILQTKDFLPPGKPGKPCVDWVSHNNMQISWDPPQNESPDIQYYVVKYALVDQKFQSESQRMEARTETAKPKMRIKDLLAGTMYSFSIVPVCRAGCGPGSETTIASVTLPTGPPFDVKDCTVTDSSIKVQWKHPEVVAKGIKIETYIVEYSLKGGSLVHEAEVIYEEGAFGTYTICGLQAETRYTIRICAQCGAAGKGSSCEPIEISTLAKAAERKNNSATALSPTTDDAVQNKCSKNGNSSAVSATAVSSTTDDAELNQCSMNGNSSKEEEKTQSKSEERLPNPAKTKPKYAEALLSTAKVLKQGDKEKGDPTIYRLPMAKTYMATNFQTFAFGYDNNRVCRHRVIMLVGATGSGKSTLINGMINYILGVEWSDTYRFKIVDEDGVGYRHSQIHSQTEMITSYTINHRNGLNLACKLTVIDTPGFGDTRGIARDRAIIDQIRDFFSNSAVNFVDHIDAIGFVAQASLARLTHTQKYVFDSVLSIFGKDIADNIMLLITFADGQRPPVLEAIKHCDVPCNEHNVFKFNNSALFANNAGIGTTTGGNAGDNVFQDNFDQMFWRMGMQSMQKFFLALNKTEARSLSLTTEVLDERKRLEVAVEGLQPQIQLGVFKLEELRREQQLLEQHEKEIEANSNFEYEVEVPKTKQIQIVGEYLTNCSKCHFTCHYPCSYGNDEDKIKCVAMTNGSCKVCPGKCIWNVHFNQKYRFEYYTVTEKRKYAELEERYKDAEGKKMTVEQVINKHQEEFLSVRQCVFVLITDSHKSLKRLQEIALKPNPLSVVEYVDLLIDSEKQEGKPGWQERVQALIDVRKEADIMGKLRQADYNPFEQYTNEFTGKGKKNKPWWKLW